MYSDYAYIDLQGRRIDSVFDTLCPEARQVRHERIDPNMCVCLESLFDVLLRKYFISTITGLVRRTRLGDIRWPVGVTYAEEWLFYLQLVRICEAGYVDEPLCLHHHTAGSMSRTDKVRNVIQNHHTLLTLNEMFADLSSEQQHIVNRHLAESATQMAYDQGREGQLGVACMTMLRSLSHELSLRRVIDACRFAGAWLVTSSRRKQREQMIQDNTSSCCLLQENSLGHINETSDKASSHVFPTKQKSHSSVERSHCHPAKAIWIAPSQTSGWDAAS